MTLAYDPPLLLPTNVCFFSLVLGDLFGGSDLRPLAYRQPETFESPARPLEMPQDRWVDGQRIGILSAGLSLKYPELARPSLSQTIE